MAFTKIHWLKGFVEIRGSTGPLFHSRNSTFWKRYRNRDSENTRSLIRTKEPIFSKNISTKFYGRILPNYDHEWYLTHLLNIPKDMWQFGTLHWYSRNTGTVIHSREQNPRRYRDTGNTVSPLVEILSSKFNDISDVVFGLLRLICNTVCHVLT